MKYTEKWLAERVKDDAGCEIWQLGVSVHNSPTVRSSLTDGPRKTLQARRIVWEMRNGPIPEGMYVTYTCGNSRCLKCLELATYSDINRRTWKQPDTRARRIASMTRGASWRTKLDMEKVRYIRETDKTLVALAKEFGVSATLISNVRRGTAWRDTSNPFAGLWRVV